MTEHGNSNLNNKPHHLYEIRDSINDEVFKYGISHHPIDADGLSKRMRLQVNWDIFFARIVMVDIDGRIEAKRIEKQYIQDYKQLHGSKPRGNIDE
jgi:hypothetical protein